ncbi:MAG: 2,3-bisphosphoglycerate-independent phosphoglycerate mutase [bacterium]|nr:2,3-bisphosphoglycerate-independent phosphoglycerate mutase [bacterium]
MKKTNVLIILDGWGIGPHDDTNPIYRAQKPTIDYFQKNYPMMSLQAAGIAVGLPWGEPGNSEVGHITLGAGRVIYQHYPRISLAIRNGEFFKNPAINEAFDYEKKTNGSIHILGLLSNGNVHSSYEHLRALIKMASLKKPQKLYFHLFTDGRDSGPQSGRDLTKKFLEDLKKAGVGKLASLSGRYYALDRTKNWQNTKQIYDLLTKGRAKIESDIDKIFDLYYGRKLSDSYIEPTLIANPQKPEEFPLVKDGDSLIFFDFREDSVHQMVAPFVLKDFSEFERLPFQNLKVTTMTEYDPNFDVGVAFRPQKIEKTLTAVLNEKGLKQLKIAETEKYCHLTLFFNGLTDKVFSNEFRILIPSKETPRFDEAPEMRASEITDRLISALQEKTYDFIAINYANPDTLAHTGNYQATIKAIEIIDGQLKQVYGVAKETGATLIITSDHGNAEKLYDAATGEPETNHNNNPVPFYLIDEKFKLAKERNSEEIYALEQTTDGVICDVAPTILELMNIPIPEEMTGKSLIKYLHLEK